MIRPSNLLMMALIIGAMPILTCCTKPQSSIQPPAFSQQKDNIVLLPIESSREYASQKNIIGAEIQKTLGTRFNVYYGSDVEQAFEKEFEKDDCSAESCIQNIATLFNSELIVDASLQPIEGDSYLTMRFINVITGELEAIKNEVCRACSISDIVEFVSTVAGDVQLTGSYGRSAFLKQQTIDNNMKVEASVKPTNLGPAKDASFLKKVGKVSFRIFEFIMCGSIGCLGEL